MRLETQQVFQVNLQLCEFLNVNLKDRGYYQVRLTAKKTSEMTNLVVVVDDSGGSNKFTLKSHVTGGVAVSKTVEVTYQDEVFSLALEDWFTFAVTFSPSPKLFQVRKLEIEVELCFSRNRSRYNTPQFETFEKCSSRTIEIPMDPSRFTAAARSIYFDPPVRSAFTLSAFSGLVSIEAVPEKKIVDTFQTANAKSDRLRRLFSTALHALVPSAKSVQQFIVKNRHLIMTNVSAVPENFDVLKEIQDSLTKFDMAGSIMNLTISEIGRWNDKIALITQQMLLLYKESKALTSELLLDYDKQRRALFREAFWFNERTMDEILLKAPFQYNEVLKSINKTQYLKKLPRHEIYCEQTDCPGERCPIIFEEKYTRNPHAGELPEGKQSTTIHPSSTMPALKLENKQHKSFRERFRTGILGPRRKSLESSQSTSRKLQRERTKTSGGLVSSEQDALKSKTSLPTPTLSPAESRSTAAGDQEEWKTAREAVSVMSAESVTASEIQRAIHPSVSADDVLSVPPEDLPSTSCQPSTSAAAAATAAVPKLQIPTEEIHPLEMMAAFELLKEREAAKKLLREEARYDGILYCEKSGKSLDGPVFTPITSKLVVGDPVGAMCKRVHLVVYVHGLDGSEDDLSGFRIGLEQAIAAAYQSGQESLSDRLADPTAPVTLKPDDPYTGPWKFDHLMSNVNTSSTDKEFQVMGTNLINELIDHMDGHTDIERISFITHSLGGIIVRQALETLVDREMQWIVDKCHTLMTINAPHLGVAYVAKHIHWGAQVVKWMKKSKSMQQLTFRDTADFHTSSLSKLAHGKACGNFKHILLLGCPADQLVPYMSALLINSKSTMEDHSRLGDEYRQMMSALLTSMRRSKKTQTVIRYTIFHQLPSSPMHKISGRAEHVMALEDDTFIEKFFNISAIQYFV